MKLSELLILELIGATVLALALVWVSFAIADPLPVLIGPHGTCGNGYIKNGSYCVAAKGSNEAVAKPPNGTCPWGWLASGSLCIRSGS
jgi:hypothetical protein